MYASGMYSHPDRRSDAVTFWASGIRFPPAHESRDVYLWEEAASSILVRQGVDGATRRLIFRVSKGDYSHTECVAAVPEDDDAHHVTWDMATLSAEGFSLLGRTGWDAHQVRMWIDQEPAACRGDSRGGSGVRRSGQEEATPCVSRAPLSNIQCSPLSSSLPWLLPPRPLPSPLVPSSPVLPCPAPSPTPPPLPSPATTLPYSPIICPALSSPVLLCPPLSFSVHPYSS